jgi:DNA-binding transcriptional regulator LsrR (DeoR family)
MLRLLAEDMAKAEIARKLGVSRMSVHRLTREPEAQPASGAAA